MNIIFMGTPNFAVPSLEALIASKHNVAAVFTQAPKLAGRGYKLTKSAIHNLAALHNIPVYTPSTLKSEDVQNLILQLEAEVIVVVAYGFIIPKVILNAKKYGCLNIHPSKLPRFRGAAPLQRTILAGDAQTSVCIMQMDVGLDTGDIILSKDLELTDKITLPILSELTSNMGAKLLLEVLNNIDTLPRIPQAQYGVTYAHKLEKAEAKIDWHKSSLEIDRQIRAFNPWPGSYFSYKEEIIKIKKAVALDSEHDFASGYIIDDKLLIACGKGMLQIETIQRQGRSEQNMAEFLVGYKISKGEILS